MYNSAVLLNIFLMILTQLVLINFYVCPSDIIFSYKIPIWTWEEKNWNTLITEIDYFFNLRKINFFYHLQFNYPSNLIYKPDPCTFMKPAQFYSIKNHLDREY